MANIASDHIKPCNIGQSEAHNKRSEEYLAHINEDKIYLRRDLMSENESWISPLMENMTLQDYYNAIALMVKEKTGRSLQTKERTRIDKKTGKVIKMNGSSPIRESVVVCKKETSMDELQAYCERCRQAWGITALQVYIHRDEGHFTDPKDETSWKPNYHAHIVWDWMNHDTGKSCKLSKEDMSQMQSMVAEALGMERGKSKSGTGSIHLERNDFIIAKQKQESERLDKEIVDKHRKANAENGNMLLSGIAYLVGKGKYSEMEKENKRLKAELPMLIEQQKELFNTAVDNQVAKEVAFLNERLHIKTTEAILNRHQWLIWQEKAQSKEAELQKAQKSLCAMTELRQVALTLLAVYLMIANEQFKKAVSMIIAFSKAEFQYILHNEQAITIKRVLCDLADTHKEKETIGNALVCAGVSEGKLDTIQERKALKEVSSVIGGDYDSRIGRNKGMGY